MSSLTPERLYALLPAVYRLRDARQGEPLRALVGVIAQEFAALEENIEQLYDDQFIETCAEWVAPYIGDLIGYRPLYGVAPRVASPRAEVAHTIAYRRRKGTAAMLEQLARDVTDWPAHVAEFFEQLATTQYMNHTRLHAQATADLRSLPKMLQHGGAFNALAHTAEMRRPEAGSGRYNIPNIGIFLWRLQPFSLTNVPLTPDAGDATGRKLRFNPLGADQPLFRLPRTEATITHLSEPSNVPQPLNVRLMALAVEAAQASIAPDDAVDDDYGAGESVLLSRPGAGPDDPPVPVSVNEICVCDLRDVVDGGGTVTGWAHEEALAADRIAIDPERGRVLLGAGVEGPLLGTAHRGFSRPIGGGEYERSPSAPASSRTARGGEALQPHLDAISGGGSLVIADSLAYRETLVFKVDGVTAAGAAGNEVVVTARNGARPLLAAAGDLVLEIGARGRLVLEGMVVSGGALTLAAAADDEPRELVLRDCTLVPGRALHADGSAASPASPSLVCAHPFASVRLERCICGPLQVQADARLELQDGIVDAGAPDAIAIAGTSVGAPGAELIVRDSTLIGKVQVRLLTLASNTIFLAQLASADLWKAPVWAWRRQQGCVRFCWVPTGSLLPRQFHCLPDAKRPDVRPLFTSLRFADPGYAQLRHATAEAIRQGADDEGEIGVMHALAQPQREANLRLRLDEYLRFGLHAGIFYAT